MATSRQQVDRPVWGTVEGLCPVMGSALSAGWAFRRGAVGHQFTFFFCIESEAETVAVFSDKL